MKAGDKIVCIDDSLVKTINSKNKNLTYGKIYHINKIAMDESFYQIYEIVYINDDSGDEFGYYKERFISVKEYRKKKLEKLNNIKV